MAVGSSGISLAVYFGCFDICFGLFRSWVSFSDSSPENFVNYSLFLFPPCFSLLQVFWERRWRLGGVLTMLRRHVCMGDPKINFLILASDLGIFFLINFSIVTLYTPKNNFLPWKSQILVLTRDYFSLISSSCSHVAFLVWGSAKTP